MIKLHIGDFSFYIPRVYQIEFEDGEKTAIKSDLIKIVEYYNIQRKSNTMYNNLFNIQETREYNSIEELKEDLAEEFI